MSNQSWIHNDILKKFREPLQSQSGVPVSQQVRAQTEQVVSARLVLPIYFPIEHQLLQDRTRLTQP
jgi:hypothetical protein